MKYKYWKAEVPKKEGWYWMRYKGKRGIVVCPAEVYWITGDFFVLTARKDMLAASTLKSFGKFHFGNEIEMPSPSLK